MPQDSILLYLHGVGDGDPDREWSAALDRSLRAIGYSDVPVTTVVAPRYSHALRGVDDDEPLPKVQVKDLRGDAKKQHRRDFERRRTAMEVRLGRDSPGEGWPVPGQAKDRLTRLLKQANNYVSKPEVRSAVLRRVLADLPPTGRVVIVGHSLGSVVAADVLRRLPPDLEVAGLVTIGSPLGHDHMQVDPLQDLLEIPPANLGWWVNFRNSSDLVTAGRGVSAVFPWVLEQRISDLNPLQSHFSTSYLSSPSVATAIGYGLFGSQSTELAVIENGLDIPLDYTETVTLLATRYAHLTMQQLNGDLRRRYAEALRLAQPLNVARIAAQNAATVPPRPLPSAIAALAVDLSDPTAEPPEPHVPTQFDIENALVPLLTIALKNPIEPFEIEVDEDERCEALQQLTLEMGLGRKTGADVLDALDTAGDVLKASRNRLKWAALGAGAAAMVAATGGLALAAAPGVAGAAAVTSALATFGPGGMIGGLLTAGTLMSAGGGSVVLGLANPGTSAEEVTAVLEARLAMAILRDKYHFDQDPQLWSDLVNTEIELQRDLARAESISDRSAASMKQLKRKREIIAKALDYLDREGLAPLD